MKTFENLWDDDVADLRSEAARAGDLVMVAVCDLALGQFDWNNVTGAGLNGHDMRKVREAVNAGRDKARLVVCDAINAATSHEVVS